MCVGKLRPLVRPLSPYRNAVKGGSAACTPLTGFRGGDIPAGTVKRLETM